MCGIFGSNKYTEYEKLYIRNKERGNFAYGSLYVAKNGLYVRKRSGVVDLTGDYAFADDYSSYLGHTQAPTSSQRKFSPWTTHPFDNAYYVVAHNGILENKDELINKYIIGHDNPVDSSIIPSLLSIMYESNDISYDKTENQTRECAAIEHVCNMLRGTFGCWIYSKLTHCTYIVRSGSTLFGNVMTGTFSSIPIPGIAERELPEGMILCVTSEGLVNCGSFKPNSPFFL